MTAAERPEPAPSPSFTRGVFAGAVHDDLLFPYPPSLDKSNPSEAQASLTMSECKSVYGVTLSLDPGQSVDLIGASEFANGKDGRLSYPTKGLIKLRAYYITSTWRGGRTIASEWVDVEVEE